MKFRIFTFLLFTTSFLSFATDFYVAPNGNDTNSGTINNPLETIKKAQELASSGDVVYIRGGLYTMREDQIERYDGIWAYVTQLNKNGVSYLAYNNEQPVFDYSNVKPVDKRIFAFYLTGSNIHIKGIDITGVQVTITDHTQSECIEVKGSNNIIEEVNMYDNMAIGIYILGGSNNLILNCDAYRNWDSVSQGGVGGNVDGFGFHVKNGSKGNVFRGCRAWLNSDDGFDTINAGEAVTIENCWSFYNGYSSSTGTLSNLNSRGDGNGFKIGGYGKGGTSYYKILADYAPIPKNVIKNCIAVGNKQSGFYANHHLEGNYWYNNTAYKNKRNYNMLNCKELNSTDYATDVPGWNHELANNLGFGATYLELTDINKEECVLNNNYFDLSVTVNAADFLSMDENELTAPRNADGSLPNINFLRLNPSSDLIDAGFDLGFSYNGTAPDLGAFESGASLDVSDFNLDTGFTNYPNPFINETKVIFNLTEEMAIKIAVYNLLGTKVLEIPVKQYNKGKNTYILKRDTLSTGNYLLVIKGTNHKKSSKMIVVQ